MEILSLQAACFSYKMRQDAACEGNGTPEVFKRKVPISLLIKLNQDWNLE